MRDRVATTVVRDRRTGLRRLVRVSVVLALVPMALALGVASAGASPVGNVAARNVAADTVTFGFGPVAVAIVVVGFGGLVAGLLRHRRRVTAAAAAPTVLLDPVVEPVTSEHAA